MIAEAHEAGLYTIVSTNAQAMTRELAEALVSAGLNRIIVSMDGLTQASYGAYRIGGDVEKAKAALRYLREAKKKLKIEDLRLQIELQCLRLKTNEQEWAELKRTYKALGADRLSLKTAQLYDYEKGHDLMPSARVERGSGDDDGRGLALLLRQESCLCLWQYQRRTDSGAVQERESAGFSPCGTE